MKQARELYHALRDALNSGADVFPAVVKSVDKTVGTCTVDYDDLTINDVRLQSIIKTGIKGQINYPAVDSVVLVERLNDEEYFVTMYSDLEELNGTVGNKVYKLDASGHLIGGGADTLKQVITLIVEAVEIIFVAEGNNPDLVKLQQAKTKLNNILV